MIDITKLTEEDKGKEVMLDNSNIYPIKYKGKIISWNEERIYVKYDYPDKKWDGIYGSETNNTTGIRTNYENLKFSGLHKLLKLIKIVTRADLMDLDDD